VVWEKAANSIFCPDVAGNIASFSAQMAFTRSLNFGASYDPFTIIGNPVTDFLASGPGDLRERANEFPDIAVDMSDGCYRGNIYVTWHESAPWTANVSAGPIAVESGGNNNNPGTADLFTIGDDVTGAITPAGDLDYWQFNATQGQNLMIEVLPQGFVCGVSGTTRQMRVRLFAATSPFPNPTGFPDSLLAASFIGSFENRIVWTAPATGTYLIRLQISGGTTTGTYTMRVRPLTFAAGIARDARDVVVVRSGNQGLTWTAPQLINDSPAGLEERRPFIGVNSLGSVTAYWHDSRDAGLGSTASLTGLYGTLSRDGGATWSPNFAVTDEESFFSFNTLAIPNLGDYNMVSAGRTTPVFHPAWSDQRTSTGDVRTPGTNTYTAGTGPNAVTTGVSFSDVFACPPDTIGTPGATIVRHFTIQNTGTIVDRYNWTVTDAAGWLVGATSGTTTPVLPSSFFDVFIQVQIPFDCNPPSDLLALAVLPVGEACHAAGTCQTTVLCDLATATLVSRFDGTATAGGVDLEWDSGAVGQISGWNLYRSATATGTYTRINATPIAMGEGGLFRYHDAVAGSGTVYYQIGGILAGGGEQVLGNLSVSLGGARAFAFAIAGANPFTDHSAVSFALPKASNVTIEVYSVTGQKVRTLARGTQDAGVHTLAFNRTDAAGNMLKAGVYLVRITAGKESRSLRLIALD